MPDVNTFHNETCFIRDETNHVSVYCKRSLRRSIYLALVRPHIGYATPVWAPQTKDVMRQVERIQQRATKFILRLPFISDQSYKDRLLKLNLLPLSYWYEHIDMIDFLFQN